MRWELGTQTDAHLKTLWRIQMKEVVRIAIMVPTGIDLWASLRSPDLLEPAIIPKRNNIYTYNTKGRKVTPEHANAFTD